MNEFVNYLNEVFAEFGHIRVRRMFGGYGIYGDDVMFALVVDNTLYLKADESTMGSFASKDLNQFEYERSGKQVRLSYYLAPEEILDNPEAAARWAKNAYDAALRARSRSTRGRKQRPQA
jgi:DNA transformation protein